MSIKDICVSGGLVRYSSYHRRALVCDGQRAGRQTSDPGVPPATRAEGRTESRTDGTGWFALTLSPLSPLSKQMSVMHVLVRRHPSNTEPIKSKEELVFHCGFRRFRASPTFSQHTTGASSRPLMRTLQ